MLSIGRTASYAIAALACLADTAKGWLLASEIANTIGAPGPYLSQVLSRLSESGLLKTKRGYRGGYALARPAAEISVLDVIEAVEGPNSLGECLLGQEYCSDDRACPTHEFWKVERERIRELLADLTLDSVADFERRGRAIPKVEPSQPLKTTATGRGRQRCNQAIGRSGARQ